MARYIDAELFADRLLNAWDTADKEKKSEIVAILSDIVTPILVGTPTADVAPRAEVAREIVEFLFRRSKSLQHLFKDDPDSAQCFRGRFELENAAVIIANDYGVDLEKKYTEGKDELA